MTTEHTEAGAFPLPKPIVATRRGVNLGCGNVTLPRAEKPRQHAALPDDLYGLDTDIRWDNVDRNQNEGVTHIENLFAYPWSLPSNTYDVAIASHVCEHIPHEITWSGRDWGQYTLENAPPHIRTEIAFFGGVTLPAGAHPHYQGGWYAWFSELWRIMKPGGIAYIITPYAWSHGAVSEPTHTRYLTAATYNYFNQSDDYRIETGQAWDMDLSKIIYAPHQDAYTVAKTAVGSHGLSDGEVFERAWPVVEAMMNRRLNAVHDMTITMKAVK